MNKDVKKYLEECGVEAGEFARSVMEFVRDNHEGDDANALVVVPGLLMAAGSYANGISDPILRKELVDHWAEEFFKLYALSKTGH